MKKEIKVIGGLGNQLFQYAFFLYIRKFYQDAYLDLSYFEGYNLHNGFELDKLVKHEYLVPYIKNSSGLKKVLGLIYKYVPVNIAYYYNEYPKIRFRYNSKVLKYRFSYFIGYWQSKIYFETIKKQMIETIEFRNLSTRNVDVAKKMEIQDSVTVHIRRGDYLQKSDFAEINVQYYINAINYLIENKHIGDTNTCIYFFSNDIDWVRSIFKDVKYTKVFVDWNIKGDSFQDLFLMTKSKCNIIANSTFSWWGAALNSRKDNTVIAPKEWKKRRAISEIYLSDWILL
jgi:hypothetical protein